MNFKDVKYEVNYRMDYIGRVLYVLEIFDEKGIGDKFLMVYKSSGFSGTGHDGQFMPFMFLNESRRINEVKGYIYKEMYFMKQYVHHRKQMYKYPKAQVFMERLEQELPYKCTFDRDAYNEDDFEKMILKFNKDAKAIIQERFFDLDNIDEPPMRRK